MDRFIRPQAMTKTLSQQLSEKADEQRRRCREWLLPFNHLVPSLSTLVRGRDATGCVAIAADQIRGLRDESYVENHILYHRQRLNRSCEMANIDAR